MHVWSINQFMTKGPRMYNGKRTVSSIMLLRKLDSHMEKKEIWLHLMPYQKIKSKWIKDLTIKSETMKLRKKTSKLCDLSLASDSFSFRYDIKSKGNKSKIDKWDYIKLKCFCIAKQTINKRKMSPIQLENIFVSHISDKGLTSKINLKTHTTQ